MNKAIFIFTMKRYLHWVTLVVGSVFILIVALATGILQSIDTPLTREIARTFLVGPMLPLLVSYSVISPQVANSQRRKDGEYLSLIFTRPISRWSYVITKWLTGSVFVLAVMAIQTALAYAVTWVASALFQTHPRSVLDSYAVTDAILNAFGFTALVVFISSMPQRIAVFVMLTYLYIVFLLTFSVGTASYLDSLSVEQVSKSVLAMGQLLFSIFVVGFDSYHVVNAASLPLASALIYFSNVVLYLTLATLVMSYREFFYAND
jgi:hypothetical protein